PRAGGDPVNCKTPDFPPSRERQRERTEENTMADRGLWVTWYDLTEKDRDAHLSWVHGNYIPKMMKKPGFLHAAHYENAGVPPAPILRHTTDPSVPTGNGYILIFGAETPHAFTRSWQAFAKGAPSRLDEGLSAED